jgi:triosephosphate isomerase
MHPSDRSDAIALAQAVAEATAGAAAEVVVCPPAIWLVEVAAALRGTAVGVGAQTMHAEESGAFTGEISPLMLAGVAGYVILGHSERRRYAGETDEAVAAKLASAVAHRLVPIAAIGESLEERSRGATEQVIERQLRAAISKLDRLAGSGLVVAYEPVWAIGTGDAASAADAQAAAGLIRALLHEADPDTAGTVRILYGGSVGAGMTEAYFAQPDVDGALVGGASLDPAGFAAIVQAAG